MAQMEQLSWEYLVDHLNEDGILALLRWARRDAPDLLKELMLAFLGERTSSVSANGSVSASPEEVSLDAVERAHRPGHGCERQSRRRRHQARYP